jgi:hypothetical protein
LENRLIAMGVAQPLGAASETNESAFKALRNETETALGRIQALWHERSAK